MLIEPASNVSVPPTVVKRILSSAPESAKPPPDEATTAASDRPIFPEASHVLPVIFVKITKPDHRDVAEVEFINVKPVVNKPVATVLDARLLADDAYPEVVNDPDPI